MLPKHRRVSLKTFPQIARGKRFNTTHFTLSVIYLQPNEPSRFSFVVSKKISKLATKRNQIKRRSSAILETLLPQCKSAVAGVFFLRPGVELLSRAALEVEIKNLLRLAGII